MQYQIYVDVLVLMNFIMDFLALQLTNKWRKRIASRGAIARASLFGSLTTTALVLIANLNGYVKLMILYVILIPIMNMIAFSSKRMKQVLINSGLTMIMLVLLTGFLNVCYTHMPFLEVIQVPMMITIILAYSTYHGISYAMTIHQARQEDVTYEVTLRNGEECLQVIGLMDTGNSLVEPISRKPVCMIADNLIQGKEVNGMTKGFCVVPFHSVGKERGILEGFEVDELTIVVDDVPIVHKDIIVAVAPSYIMQHGEYRIILHPQFLKGY